MAPDEEPSGNSFLPRIKSVFYAVFDPTAGPQVVYQVPEGLISTHGSSSHPPANLSISTSVGAFSPHPSRESNPNSIPSTPISRKSSGSIMSPTLSRAYSSTLFSPRNRATSSNRTLFSFDDVSKYIIPVPQLCGRLVTCSTRNCKLMGFPVERTADSEHAYPRVYFRYNLCFVFDRSADLSCYEPIVRKVSRVLSSCEEESCFLSDPSTRPAIHGILEQLYEDLNSYSETSISVDRFNSIELKIFPFYPNPPPVHNWSVPLALIKLGKRMESNWDLTMVCGFIDGINHVSRIAYLAQCDLNLVRKAISHLMYYQVVMMIDIFQFSNMYTLRREVQSLADAPHVRDECASYVMKPSCDLPDWPKLLHLYSRFKPGKTVQEWMETNNITELGIDVRRFTSFGVIKGFLRRVHRWPIYIPEEVSETTNFTVAPPPSPNTPELQFDARHQLVFTRGRLPEAQPASTPITAEAIISPPRSRAHSLTRQSSQAELALEQLRTRDIANSGSSPRTALLTQGGMRSRGSSDARRRVPSTGFSSIHMNSTSLLLNKANANAGAYGSSATGPLAPRPPRPAKPSRPPSVRTLPRIKTKPPSDEMNNPEFLALLDGEHHTDELATKFEVGWPTLERWLVAIGGGTGNGDFGDKVIMIYR